MNIHCDECGAVLNGIGEIGARIFRPNIGFRDGEGEDEIKYLCWTCYNSEISRIASEEFKTQCETKYFRKLCKSLLKKFITGE